MSRHDTLPFSSSSTTMHHHHNHHQGRLRTPFKPWSKYFIENIGEGILATVGENIDLKSIFNLPYQMSF